VQPGQQPSTAFPPRGDRIRCPTCGKGPAYCRPTSREWWCDVCFASGEADDSGPLTTGKGGNADAGPTGNESRKVAASNHPVPLAVNLDDLLARTFSPRRWIVPGLIQEKDTAMVFAPRGTGKTYFVLSLGYAVSCGEPFLKFRIEHASGVLLVDGEMPAEDLQERLAKIAAAVEGTPREPFKILSADLLEDGIATLASSRGQEIVEANLEGIKLVIVDSISTLCGGRGRENEAESWEPMQAWLLSLRRRGIAALLVHHAGKGGDQRGTSKREDVMTQVLKLSPPPGYCPSEGAVFEARFTKSRGLTGEPAKPFEAKLAAGPTGGLEWSWRDLEDSTRERVGALQTDGLKPNEIAAELEINRSTVYRHLRAIKRGADD